MTGLKRNSEFYFPEMLNVSFGDILNLERNYDAEHGVHRNPQKSVYGSRARTDMLIKAPIQ